LCLVRNVSIALFHIASKSVTSCGASKGNSPVHLEAARALAQSFHENNITLVYGGGTVGIMGELARTLVSLSGPNSVHGIIPQALMKYEQGDSKNLPDESVYGQTTIVQDMHSRKQLMAKKVLAGGPGSGFVALSGGYGTLEELMEVTTWNQLGIHDKGVVLFNVDGYWDGLLSWVKNAVQAGFIASANGKILAEAKQADGVVKALRDYVNSESKMKLAWEVEG
jgi:uncharacterized protein (TIGR00730 family)